MSRSKRAGVGFDEGVKCQCLSVALNSLNVRVLENPNQAYSAFVLSCGPLPTASAQRSLPCS